MSTSTPGEGLNDNPRQIR